MDELHEPARRPQTIFHRPRKRRSATGKAKKRRILLDSGDTISPCLAKYWRQRYSLFSKYDAGVQLDEEGWFSATPESIAAVHAHRSAAHAAVVLDCFAGVGGNAIQFASRGCYVVAIEIDPMRVELARNNAEVYGVDDKIEFIVGDFFQLAPSLKGDVVFLSPPWGGPTYCKIENFTLDLLKPKDGYTLFQVAQKITPNIIMYLPRNVDLNQVEQLSWLSSPPLNCEIEENYVEGYSKGMTAYFGDLASELCLCQLHYPESDSAMEACTEAPSHVGKAWNVKN